MDGETMETVKDFIFLGSKISVEMLVLWKKNYDKPRQYIKKQRDITLPTKVCRVKAMFFPIVMYWCESCTIKKAEDWRTDAFEL